MNIKKKKKKLKCWLSNLHERERALNAYAIRFNQVKVQENLETKLGVKQT